MVSVAEVIKGDGKEIPDVVKRWVERYERNQKSAMAELLTVLFEVRNIYFGNNKSLFVNSSLCIPSLFYFLGQACGAKHQLQEEDIDKTDVDDVVVDLVSMARKVSFAF